MARHSTTALLLAGLLLAAGCSSAQPGSATGTTTTAAAPSGSAVIAIKIDNVDPARPSTGLASADAIYVVPVEAGLTRIVAVFSHPPQVVGPVRSARQTDIDLLAQFGRPTFAYSGSVPQLQGPIKAASLVNASQAAVPGAFVRDSSRIAPHNLFVHPAQLPAGTGPQDVVLATGPAPAGGTPTTAQQVHYPNASYEFRWSAQSTTWLIWMDGTPYVSTNAGQLGAATVVIQHVTTYPEAWPEDSSGAVAPVARTIGSGPATVLRDGKAYTGTWSRGSAAAPTRYSVAGSGAALPLATGQVWIMLVSP